MSLVKEAGANLGGNVWQLSWGNLRKMEMSHTEVCVWEAPVQPSVKTLQLSFDVEMYRKFAPTKCK